MIAHQMISGNVAKLVLQLESRQMGLQATSGQPRRTTEKHTFKNSSDAFQTAPKDLYTLNSLPVVYLNPRLVASRSAASCESTERLSLSVDEGGF